MDKKQPDLRPQILTKPPSGKDSHEETLEKIKSAVRLDLQHADKKASDALHQIDKDEIALLKQQNADLVAQHESGIVNQHLIDIALTQGAIPQAQQSIQNQLAGLFKLNSNGKLVHKDGNIAITPESAINHLKVTEGYLFQGYVSPNAQGAVSASYEDRLASAAAENDYDLYKKLRKQGK